MDLVSQGILGSCIAVSAAKKEEISRAGLIGLLSGLTADIDFFIRSASDPLLNLEFHRHFTHSIFIIPIAALILSFIFWPFFRRHLRWHRIYLYSLMGYLFSGFLDACTSYGTTLLWPLSDDRISLNIISIVDPVFTLVLITGLIIAIKKRSTKIMQFAVIIAAGYLGFGGYQNHSIEKISQQIAQDKNHTVERLLVKPTLGNLFLWRSIYRYQGYYYVNAIRSNPFTNNVQIFPGKRIQRFDPANNQLGILGDSVLQKDIERFAHFSDQYLALHPQKSDIIIDVRFANLPNQILPLWGIEFDPTQPQQHATFNQYRDSSKENRSKFINMLFN